MFAATDRGIWRSDDDGQSWSEKTQGLPWKQIQSFAGAPDAAKKLVLLYCLFGRDDHRRVADDPPPPAGHRGQLAQGLRAVLGVRLGQQRLGLFEPFRLHLKPELADGLLDVQVGI